MAISPHPLQSKKDDLENSNFNFSGNVNFYNMFTCDLKGELKQWCLKKNKHMKIDWATDLYEDNNDRTSRSVSPENENSKRLVRNSTKLITTILVSDDGQNLYTWAGKNAHLKQWNILNRGLVRDWGNTHSSYVWAVAICHEKNYLFSGDELGTVKQWNFLNGELVKDWGRIHK